MRTFRFWMWMLLLVLAVGAWRVAAGMAQSQRTVHLSAVLSIGQRAETGGYSVVGPPTVSVSFIDRVLAAYHSPAVGLGSVIEAQGVHYGIDPVYALAFFWHESGFGTTGEAQVTLSPGNERCLQDRPCIDQDRGGYAQMQSWADGFDHWYRLLLYGYVKGEINRDIGRVVCPCLLVEQIIPVYAPSSDHNDEAAYIAAVEHAVDVWRSGQVWV
jgi:hypothetical protein